MTATKTVITAAAAASTPFRPLLSAFIMNSRHNNYSNLYIRHACTVRTLITHNVFMTCFINSLNGLADIVVDGET